jgi:hypothetical protein
MKTILTSIGQPRARLGNLYTLCAVALMALVTQAARASDPVAIYGFVDRVVFEPSEGTPERVQVWGGFALAKKTENRSEYYPAERGYLHFKLRPGEEEICKKEWADLKSVAGKKEIVAFGSRYSDPQPKLRKESDKVENPDAYPKSWGGVTKMRKLDYGPVKDLGKLMEKPAKEAPKAKASPPPSKSLLALVSPRGGNK